MEDTNLLQGCIILVRKTLQLFCLSNLLDDILNFVSDDICNKVRYLGTIGHPYTPHKYIVCGKELNIMQCPGNTCYDDNEHNCVQCKADRKFYYYYYDYYYET